MKKLLLVLVLLAPAMLFAQNAFNGTWHFNPQSTQFSGKPLTQSLQNGVYRCDWYVPKIEVNADGKDHDRSGSPYADRVSVREIDDHTIEVISKKGGKVVRTTKDTASPDGKTLTSEWSFVAENGQEVHGKTIYTRVAAAPDGANQASGSWQPGKMDSASESFLTVTYKVTEDGLSLSDPTGESYTARFDGKDYPFKGDPGTTSVSLKRIDDNTVEETYKRDGKVILISRMTVSADGRTMKVENTDVLRGGNTKFEGNKQ